MSYIFPQPFQVYSNGKDVCPWWCLVSQLVGVDPLVIKAVMAHLKLDQMYIDIDIEWTNMEAP